MIEVDEKFNGQIKYRLTNMGKDKAKKRQTCMECSRQKSRPTNKTQTDH